MKKFYLTIDLEEWYHLLYFKKYTNFKGDDFFIHKTKIILNYLEEKKIKATFFVLGELAEKYPKIIKLIYDYGHEISCHGYNHDLVYNKTENQFIKELIKAKKILDKIIEGSIIGYRAPCFSLTNNHLSKLKDIGFKYDSSFIKFSNHKLYSQLKLKGYKRENSLILKKNNFYEVEIPTINFFGLNLPISGGGYLRIIPFFIFQFFYKKELKKRNEYLLFLHPFELINSNFELPIKVKLIDYLRFSYGRKKNLNRLSKLIDIAKNMNYKFETLNSILS